MRASTFVVDNTNDDDDDNPGDGFCFSAAAGGCTLRAAIQESNQHAGPDRIHFAIPGPGVKAIPQLSLRIVNTSLGLVAVALPVIIDEVVIDGSTQGGPGYKGPPLIEIQSTAGSAAGICLFVPSSNVTLRGLIIGGYETGITLHNGGGCAVQGCYIGTDATGTAANRNSTGMVITSPGNTIGGSSPAQRNLISGNGVGITIAGATATGNSILWNYIGTDVLGTSSLENSVGMVLTDGASQNVIGSGEPGDRNVISGTGQAGIAIMLGSNGNSILGNIIGPDVNGNDMGSHNGVSILSSSNNRVGTTRAGEGNVIAFGMSGVYINDLATETTNGNSVRGNSIFENDYMGIKLTNDAAIPTPNDPLDADAGANGLQNFPDLVGAVSSAVATVVTGSLSSLPEARFAVDFYSSPSCGVSGFGEGETYLQSLVVTTGPDGLASFELQLDDRVSPGRFITATATNADTRDTSEFSRCVKITDPFIVTNTNDAGPGSLRAAIVAANATPGTSRIEFDIPDRAVFHTIGLKSPLPEIVEPVEVAGSSQPGFHGSPVVVLDGLLAGSGANGLVVSAGNCLVEGLVVQRFGGSGIVISGPGRNTVRGCFLGTDAAGLTSAANGENGITIEESPDNLVGGDSPGAGNVIAGNGGAGVIILGPGAKRNRVLGNAIGTDLTAGEALGNAGDGVRIVLGAAGNVIGGVGGEEGNQIGFNATGVRIAQGPSTGNRVRGNSIFSNVGLGIDLGDPGRNANDTGDIDVGPNGLQNSPDLRAVSLVGDELTIQGFLESVADTDFVIDVYASLPGDGDSSARTYLGSRAVKTRGTRADFEIAVSLPTPEATVITATATRAAAPFDTSELSAGRTLREVGGRQVPGDCNQDSVLDISDARCFLSFLYEGRPTALPCGDGSVTDPANVALMDWQPDGVNDLSDAIGLLGFLFNGGAPHPLALAGYELQGCVRILGCPDVGLCVEP